jgi:hypothetical protein
LGAVAGLGDAACGVDDGGVDDDVDGDAHAACGLGGLALDPGGS